LIRWTQATKVSLDLLVNKSSIPWSIVEASSNGGRSSPKETGCCMGSKGFRPLSRGGICDSEVEIDASDCEILILAIGNLKMG